MNLPNLQPIPWKSWGAALAALLACAFFWNRDHRAKTDALRDAEAARLALGQQIVASQDSRQELQANLKDMLEQNELLREAYEAATKAAPDAKPAETAVLKTVPARVVAAPRPLEIAEEDPGVHPPAPPPCDRPLVPDGHGGFLCPDAPPKKRPAECVLANGDATSFSVEEIVLRTDKGNRLLTGTAEFWRELPAPRSKLAAGKFSSALSSTATQAEQAPPRWGVEAAALCTSAGCGLGAGVLLPPVSFLGLRWEARVDAYAGPALAGGAALGVRW